MCNDNAQFPNLSGKGQVRSEDDYDDGDDDNYDDNHDNNNNNYKDNTDNDRDIGSNGIYLTWMTV